MSVTGMTYSSTHIIGMPQETKKLGTHGPKVILAIQPAILDNDFELCPYSMNGWKYRLVHGANH